MSDGAEILAQIKNNATSLKDCAGPHEFVQGGNSELRRFFCKKCGGEVNAQSAHWYNAGLAHGRMESAGFYTREERDE